MKQSAGVNQDGEYRKTTQAPHGGTPPHASASAGTNAYLSASQALAIQRTNSALAAHQVANPSLNQLQLLNTFICGVDLAKHEKLEPLPRETVVGEVVAWRGWALNYTPTEKNFNFWMNLRLISIYQKQHQWQPGATFESKPPNDHDHDDGVHAFKTREQASRYLTTYYPSALLVLGRVLLWGEVVECEVGYRAQFAAIESLDEVLNNTVQYEGNVREFYEKEQRCQRPDELLQQLRVTYDLNEHT